MSASTQKSLAGPRDVALATVPSSRATETISSTVAGEAGAFKRRVCSTIHHSGARIPKICATYPEIGEVGD